MNAEKAALRRAVRSLSLQMTPEERRSGDGAMFDLLRALPEFQAARCLFLYAGIDPEPDTLFLAEALLREGRRVAMPRTLPERGMEACLISGRGDLRAGYCGIPEPEETLPALRWEEIDFVLVPALCYDRRGYRLGQGGGYYDRWLAGYTGFTAGLCRAALLRDALPDEAHDRRVRAVVTEWEILRPDGRP